MNESRCVHHQTTCDRCREDCWPEWTVKFTVLHAGEPLEILVCDACVDEMADEIIRFRDGGER